MPLEINSHVFITCAVTGSGATQDRSPHVPPQSRGDSWNRHFRRKSWAAIVHCHARDPETRGVPHSRKESHPVL